MDLTDDIFVNLWTMVFFILCKCLAIFQVESDEDTALCNFEKSSKIGKNLAKNEGKPSSNCLKKPISPQNFQNLKPEFRIYTHHQIHYLTKEEMLGLTLILKKNPMLKSACCLDIDIHIFFSILMSPSPFPRQIVFFRTKLQVSLQQFKV